MTPAELEPLLELMRKHKVLRMSAGGVMLELSPLSFVPEPQAAALPEPGPIGAQHGNPTDEEFLFWSSLPVTSEDKADG